MKIKIYGDAGHAWGKVRREDVNRLNVSVSAYSYERNGAVYLEEDCDLPAFIRAAELMGESVDFVEMKSAQRDSKIRSYDSFH